jgi:hypothetical protein
MSGFGNNSAPPKMPNLLVTPNLGPSFPSIVPDLKIKPDLDNRAHGPHYDVLLGIPGGTDQLRVSPDGDVLGGSLNIGKKRIDW